MTQLIIGGMMISFTVIIHALVLDRIIKYTGAIERKLRSVFSSFWKPFLSAFVVLIIFISHIAHIWLWTLVYLGLDSLPNHTFSDVLYFSTVTYTTLGYGDIILEPTYRMLSGIEAANGLLLFGWTTAFIFEVFSRLYRNEAKSI